LGAIERSPVVFEYDDDIPEDFEAVCLSPM